MTKRECAIIMTYTGTCMLTGDDLKYFYEYIDEYPPESEVQSDD